VKQNLKKRGLVEMIGATLIWGSTPIVGILSNLPSPVFVFFRVVFAFPFIFYFAVKRAGIKEFFRLKPFWPLFISGIFLAVNWIFFFWALNLTTISTVVVLYYTGPIVSIILAVLFLREKFNKNILFAVILALIGVVISNFDNGFKFNLGAFIALFAGISYGFLGFFSKIATMHHRAVSVTAWQILISIILTAPFLFLNDFEFSFVTLIIVLIAGIVHTALALFLWYDSLNFISVSIASILQYLDIFFAMLFGLFLGQIPTFYQLTGGVLIALAGVVGSRKEAENS